MPITCNAVLCSVTKFFKENCKYHDILIGTFWMYFRLHEIKRSYLKKTNFVAKSINFSNGSICVLNNIIKRIFKFVFESKFKRKFAKSSCLSKLSTYSQYTWIWKHSEYNVNSIDVSLITVSSLNTSSFCDWLWNNHINAYILKLVHVNASFYWCCIFGKKTFTTCQSLL